MIPSLIMELKVTLRSMHASLKFNLNADVLAGDAHQYQLLIVKNTLPNGMLFKYLLIPWIVAPQIGIIYSYGDGNV